jgi:flagellar protein FlaG
MTSGTDKRLEKKHSKEHIIKEGGTEMLLESINSSRMSQVGPSDLNAQPGRPVRSIAGQKAISKTGEAIVRQNSASAEITQEFLNLVGDNFKMIHDVDLQFLIHEGTGRTYVRVIRGETGEIIREIPPEQILNLAAKIDEMMGILYDQKV